MPPSAAIDVGSNTFRLLIGNVRNNMIEDVLYERNITRLAEGINKGKMLKDGRIEASVAALKEFSSVIQSYGIKTVRAIGTSALREAYNADIFIRRVLADTGIPIEVISGEKEAEFTLKGILSSLPDSMIAHHSIFIVDIGGGSTEWILCRGKDPVDMGSIPIGVIKLNENFISTDPVSESDISALIGEILSSLESLKKKVGHHIDRRTCFIGTAGTFSTLASVDLQLKTYSRKQIHLHRISLSRLWDMLSQLVVLPLEERKTVIGLEPERADLIIPGIQFTINIMEIFGFDELIVSDYGLLEGVLLETLKNRDEKDIPKAS